jgi:opacity protein-like surface antigen
MKMQQQTSCALGLCLALMLSAAAEAKAQVDTTRRDTSQVRIPIRKNGPAGMTTSSTTPSGVTRRESGGSVAVTMTRIDSLEATARMYETRLDSLEALNASSATRVAALEARIGALADSLATTRNELSTARTELASLKTELDAANTRIGEVDTRLQGLNDRFNRFRNRSLFGNSGFYVGLGTGASFTSGTLREIGYESAPLISMPIGWHKPGSMLGLRTEWTLARLEGVEMGSFFNPDPTVASGVALATLNFPINSAKSNNIYLMGGGGFYMFRDFGTSSGLADKFSGSDESGGDTETKWGFQAGAGLEIHVLGATSLFVQSSLTNVAADRGTVGEEGRNLRWMPVTFGFILR